MTPAQIELQIASALQRVAVYARGPRVEDAGVEGVVSRRLGIGCTGIKSCSNTEV